MFKSKTIMKICNRFVQRKIEDNVMVRNEIGTENFILPSRSEATEPLIGGKTRW